MNTRKRAGGVFVVSNPPIFKKKKSTNKTSTAQSITTTTTTTTTTTCVPSPPHYPPSGIGITSTTCVTSPQHYPPCGIGITNTSTTCVTSPPHYPPCRIGITTTRSASVISPPHYEIGSSSSIDVDCLEFEILNRLPLKSLSRFKSVCKRWCYLIQKDQQFIDLHLTRFKTCISPRLFMVVPQPPPPDKSLQDGHYFNFWPYKEFHITADFLFEEDNTKLKLVVDTVKEVDSSSYNAISNPVNGLICLIDSYWKDVACIRSISTEQVSPWFQPSSIVVGEEYVGFPNYFAIGFDPATNEHKLVCVLTIRSYNRKFKYFLCGVLTIGRQSNNRWRRIKEVPPNPLNDDYVYVNGVIYWSNSSLDLWASRSGYRPVYLVAFDVGNEKFRTITIPDFILEHPRVLGGPLSFKNIAQLVEVDGNLAMIVKLNNCMFNMYVYEDGDYKDKDEKINGTPTSSSLQKGIWKKVSCITLPFYMRNSHTVKFRTFIGSKDKILVTSSIWDLESTPFIWDQESLKSLESREKKKWLSIYCYNWKKGTWTEVDVSGIPSSVPQLCPSSVSTTFSESLLSLNNHRAL